MHGYFILFYCIAEREKRLVHFLQNINSLQYSSLSAITHNTLFSVYTIQQKDRKMQSQVCKKYTLSTERSQIFQIQNEVMKMRQKDIPRDLRKKSLNSSVSSVSSFDLKKSFRWLITNWKHFSFNFSMIIDI